MTDKTSHELLASRFAFELANELFTNGWKVVLAESCTGGLVAAMLGRIPGISGNFCGSKVTYRESTKQEWLGIDGVIITEHTPESSTVAEQMAIQSLTRTSEADFSAAVTGHLGPDAPIEKDGLVFIAVAQRSGDVIELVDSQQYHLTSSNRVPRQYEATALTLRQLFAYAAGPVRNSTI